VVQQRSGPVASTDRGDGLSVSHPSDPFERAAEATARSAMRGPTPVQRGTATTDGGRAPDVPGRTVAVQRNVGLEIEDSNWMQSGEDGRPLPKKTPLVHRNYFQLQAESPDLVELVTDPPGVANRSDYEQMKASMIRLEKQLIAQQYRAGMGGEASRFRADRLEGGVHYAFLHPGAKWQPHLQVTAGVPLAGIPKFFELMRSEARVPVRLRSASEIEPELRGLLRLPARTGSSSRRDSGGPRYRAPSKELLGFTEMLSYYLYEGANAPEAQFAKAVFAIMARTDFAASFALLDAQEQAAIAAHLDEWVRLMVRSFAYYAREETTGQIDDPVLDFRITNAFRAGRSMRAANVDTSRDDWLRGIVRGHDLLSTHGRAEDPTRGTDERNRLGRDVVVEYGGDDPRSAVGESLTDLRRLMRGMGELRDRTDTVTYANVDTGRTRDVPAVIVEVRRTTGVRRGAGGWVETADVIYDAVEAAVEEAASEAEVVAPAPSVQPNPAVRQDSRAEAIRRRARNGFQDLVLKARKGARGR
jgi:hypothetical protein